MGIGSFSSEETRVLNEKFKTIQETLTKIQTHLETKLNEFKRCSSDELNKSKESIETNLTAKIVKINNRIDSLKATGGTILDEPGIKTLFNEAKKTLNAEQEKLNSVVKQFILATKSYEKRLQDLYDKEEELIKRESLADADFASKREIQLAPLKKLERALNEKESHLIKIQEEYNRTFLEKESKLKHDFDTLNADLNKNFTVLESKLNEDRKDLSERENELNEREKEVSKRETEVRAGLTQERQQDINEIDRYKKYLEEKSQELKNKELELHKKALDLDSQNFDLQTRIDNVYQRECIADQGFIELKAEMQNDIEALRKVCLENIKKQEEEASLNRELLLNETIKFLQNERNKSLLNLKEELSIVRNTAENEIKNSRLLLENDKAEVDQLNIALQLKLKEIKKQEVELNEKAEKLENEKKIINFKLKTDEEKFKKIASIKIEEAEQRTKTFQEINNQLREELSKLRLKYEEQKNINDRFENESSEEIYASLKNLEIENDRLKHEITNLRTSKTIRN